MKRPELNMIDLNEGIANVTSGWEKKIITLSPGQCDALLDEGYNRGALLLEIDQNEPDKSTPPTSNKRLGGNPGRRLATNFY